jgi:hypothetical protein
MKKFALFVILFLFYITVFATYAEETEQRSDEESETTEEGMDTSSSGYTPGETEVGNSGAFTYSFPIKLPEGTNGTGPKLALVHNSQWHNGILGKSWMLTGMQEITRDPSYPINLDTNDHFLYNGRKLIWVPENTPGVANPGYFHTEQESYLRIRAHNLGTPSSYWTVTHKDGRTMYYGYTSRDHTPANDGHIDVMGKAGKTRLWALSKAADIHGNYYTIEYYEDTEDDTIGGYYPVKITWTKGNSQTKYYTVEFLYESRPDYGKKYIPTRVEIDKRLVWIVVKAGGNLLRKYRLDYDEGIATGRSRLTKIVEYGDDGNIPYYGNFPLAAGNYSPTG